MAKQCQICTHKNRELIDRSVAEGQSVSGVCRKFRISRAAYYWHRNEHVHFFVPGATVQDLQRKLADTLTKLAAAHKQIDGLKSDNMNLRTRRVLLPQQDSVARALGVLHFTSMPDLLALKDRRNQFAKKFHPDVYNGDSSHMELVNESYELLSDIISRLRMNIR